MDQLHSTKIGIISICAQSYLSCFNSVLPGGSRTWQRASRRCRCSHQKVDRQMCSFQSGYNGCLKFEMCSWKSDWGKIISSEWICDTVSQYEHSGISGHNEDPSTVSRMYWSSVIPSLELLLFCNTNVFMYQAADCQCWPQWQIRCHFATTQLWNKHARLQSDRRNRCY